MNLYLKRKHFSSFGVDGRLYVAHQEVADTIEHPTCHLPCGTYQVVIRHNTRLRRKVPTLTGSDTFRFDRLRCPIIGIGNGPFKLTDGSINIGKAHIHGVVTHSNDTFCPLIDRLDKAFNRGESITLTIS